MKNLTLSNELGTATLVGNFESNSPEWHDLRKSGIGGSDIAAICRVSPWTSPFALWAKKTGRIDDTIAPSEAAEWGTILETVVIDKFEAGHPEYEVIRKVGTWANIDRPWQLANPDALLRKDGEYGIFEAKTAAYEDDWKVPPLGVIGTADGVPIYYRTQVRWYLQTFGFAWAIVGVLFHGNKYREFLVEANTFEQEVNLKEAEKFLAYVQEDAQPDYDGALSTYEAIRQIHPDIEDDSVELGDLYIHYANALHDETAATEKANEMRSRVLDAMGKAKRGTYEDETVVTRQSRKGGTPYLVNKKKG